MVEFTQKTTSTLSDEELINNIAIIKSGKDFPNKEKLSSDALLRLAINFETVLESRGWDDADIDIKVKDAMEGIENSSGGGFWGKSDKIIGTASDVADVVGKFKGFFTKGGTYDDTDGSEYDIKPKEDIDFNYTPYIIGGVGFLVVVGGLLYFLSKKKR